MVIVYFRNGRTARLARAVVVRHLSATGPGAVSHELLLRGQELVCVDAGGRVVGGFFTDEVVGWARADPRANAGRCPGATDCHPQRR